MAGAKETPRQKMIGMMYLVLTALLALNVSVGVIDSFSNVNKGIETSISSIEKKIDDYYKTFEQQYQKDKVKTAKPWQKAQEIRVKTDEIINYIEGVKLELLLENNGITREQAFNQEGDEIYILNPDRADSNKHRRIFHEINFSDVNPKDKEDAVVRMMIENGKATELRTKIEEYRQYIIKTIEDYTHHEYDSHIGLKTEDVTNVDGEVVSWERQNFDKVIPPAAFTIINNMVAEIQTAEFDAIAELFKSIGASDYKFNKLEAKVFPKSTYVLSGGEYEAQIYIAGTDTERKFDAKFARGVKDFKDAKGNAIQTVSSKDGVVTIKIPAEQEGENYFAGVVEMINPETGKLEPYPFESTFAVAPPAATVSPTKMNVMYRNIENPISVSAPGFKNEDIKVTVSNGNGTIKEVNKTKGEYVIVPGKENETIITASTMVDGKEIALGTQVFRIKAVPDPMPSFNGEKGGSISKNDLLALGSVDVKLVDFDFGDYEFKVVSYEVETTVGGYVSVEPNNGSKFSDKVIKNINAAKRGQTFYFTNIKVIEPNGVTRKLDESVMLKAVIK
ncbi:MAG: hypothetical protein IKU01_11250 [Bacteroidales bacterium]|nr:hypothetical protein [Bacteroidales bacterium]